MFSASTGYVGSLPSHQDSDPSCRVTLARRWAKRYRLFKKGKSLSSTENATATRYSQLAKKNRGSSWLLMSHSSPHPDFDPPSWVCAYHHLHKSRLGRHSARNWGSGVALWGTTRQDKQPGRVNFPESRPTCSMGKRPDSYDVQVLAHVSTPQGTADGWAGGPIPQLLVWSGWQRWRLWLVQPGTVWCAPKV